MDLGGSKFNSSKFLPGFIDRNKYCCVLYPGRLRVDQVKRLKELETENARLKRAIADLTLDKQILREAAEGNF